MNPRAELERLTTDLQSMLGESLFGICVHGSLALGCFNPSLSDLDVIVVTRTALTPAQRQALEPVLRARSRLEIHFLTRSSLETWRYPTPFDLHFGSERLVEPGVDHDLAAHVTVASQAGITLVGPPPRDVFPDVPWTDYEDSLRRDLQYCSEHGGGLYTVLGPARIWATLTEGVVHSKLSGAAWALDRAPAEFRPLLTQALEAYRSGASEPWFARDEVRPWAEFVVQALESEDDAPPEAGFARREAHRRRKT